MATGKSMGSRKPMATSKEPTPEYVCPHCGKLKKKSAFYMSSDPAVSIGVAFPCKDCAEKIARNYNEKSGKFGEVTLSSLKNALCYLDKPFLEILYDASYNEVHDESLVKPKTNIWSAYIVNVQMPQYKAMRWRDGDLANEGKNNSFDIQENALDPESEQYLLYKKNKKAVIDFVGWDPFKNYPREDELPLLYAQLLTFLDDETKNDGQKLNAVIQIVKLFNQAEKINTAIDELQIDTQKIIANTGAVKSLRDAASKAISDANALAKDNGINTIVPA